MKSSKLRLKKRAPFRESHYALAPCIGFQTCAPLNYNKLLSPYFFMGYLKKPLSILQKNLHCSPTMPPGRKGAPFSFFLQSFHKWVGSFRPSIYAILCLRSWSCWAKGSCRGAAVKRWFPPFHWSREGLLPRPIIDRDFTDAEGSLLTKPPTWEASRQKEATRKRSAPV